VKIHIIGVRKDELDQTQRILWTGLLTNRTLAATKAGYKMVSAPKVPNKLGAVQLDNIVMEAVPAGK